MGKGTVVYIHNIVLFQNEIMSFAGKWKGLEIIILSKIGQIQTIACFLSYVESRFLKRHERGWVPVEGGEG
jgi:hypothetical protein